MPTFHITTSHLTATRGANGSDEMSGSHVGRDALTWATAVRLFGEAVRDAFKASGLNVSEAEISHQLIRACSPPIRKGGPSRVVNVGTFKRVRLSRTD